MTDRAQQTGDKAIAQGPAAAVAPGGEPQPLAGGMTPTAREALRCLSQATLRALIALGRPVDAPQAVASDGPQEQQKEAEQETTEPTT